MGASKALRCTATVTCAVAPGRRRTDDGETLAVNVPGAGAESPPSTFEAASGDCPPSSDASGLLAAAPSEKSPRILVHAADVAATKAVARRKRIRSRGIVRSYHRANGFASQTEGCLSKRVVIELRP